MNSEFDKETSSLRDGRYLNRSTILMFCVLAAGLLLRIYDLAGESLWLDEGTSIRRSQLSLINIVFELISNVHPPLYFFILHYWIGLFGDSEFSARFLSVIFGFSSIIMIYRLGVLLFNKHIGILSALLLSLSEFHIRFSQEVRGYSMMVFLTLVSMYFFMRLREGKERKFVWGYILSSSALMYTHNYGLLIILAQNMYVLSRYLLRKNAQHSLVIGWWRLQIVLGLLYLPWLFILLNQVASVQQSYWISQPAIKTLLDTFIKYAGSRRLLILYTVLTAIGLSPYLFLRTRRAEGGGVGNEYAGNTSSSKNVGLLIVWMLTPALLPFVVSQFSAPIYQFKYTISASLPFYILTARGIEQFSSRYLKFGIIALIIILSVGNLYGYFTKINKQQWREVAIYIEKNASDKDVIVLSPGYTLKGIFDYYSKRSDLNKIPFNTETGHIKEDERKKIEAVVKGFDVVWLVTSCGADRNEFKTVLENMHYNMSYHMTFDGSGTIMRWFVIELQVFKRKADG